MFVLVASGFILAGQPHRASVAFPVATQARPNAVSVGPNVDVSNELGPQAETTIAVNPGNPSQMVAGSIDFSTLSLSSTKVRAYFSSDAGATWGSVLLPLPPPMADGQGVSAFDPGVAWDALGNVYFSHMVVFRPTVTGQGISTASASELAVDRSSDGGRNWSSSYFAFQSGDSFFNDKPMIAVDTNPSSPHKDTIYVAWVAIGGPLGILLSRSTDHGVTFSSPVSPSAGLAGGGPDPYIGPDGTLYVAWLDGQLRNIFLSASTDGGQTFGPKVIVTRLSDPFPFVPADSSRGAWDYPACGADSSQGAHRGTLYCSWMDETPADGTDIFVARSLDRGLTWSAPVRVNDDPLGVANDQFNQWLSVDPVDGSVSLSWYDTRNDPTRLMTDVFLGRSADGGLSFGPNVQVTTAPTNETCPPAHIFFQWACGDGVNLFFQYGDYEGIAAFGGVVHPVWTDRRASVSALGEEVFTATISV